MAKLKSKKQQKAAAGDSEAVEQHKKRVGVKKTDAVDTSEAVEEPVVPIAKPAKRKLAEEAAEQPEIVKASKLSRFLDVDVDEDSLSDTSEDEPAQPVVSKGPFRNKEKVLLLTSRGIPSR